MKVCYFGIYDRDYTRNRIIIKGLKQNGVEVVECYSNLSGIFKYWDLIKKHWVIRKDYDVMIVGFPGNQAMVLARFLTKKPIIFDAFLSFYDTMVFDRQICSPKSFRAKYYWLLDCLACKLADRILLDTNIHINYFTKTFKIKSEKFYRIFVGADDSVFYPQEEQARNGQFLVHFHGRLKPMQGVEYIVEAAQILRHKNIIFQIVGGGQGFKKINEKVCELGLNDIIQFIKTVPSEDVPKYVAKSDICLGIFGNTPKTKRVVPNKIYECIAMRKPVITADTPAVREVFKNGQELIFCQLASGESLAQGILELKNNPELRNRTAANGYNLYTKKFHPRVLGKDVFNILRSINKWN